MNVAQAKIAKAVGAVELETFIVTKSILKKICSLAFSHT